MKQLIFGAIMASLFICAFAFAEAKLNKVHKGMDKDGQKVNCAYCHKKAGAPKEGTNYAKYKSGKFCAGNGCH